MSLTGENLAVNRAFVATEDPSIEYPVAIGTASAYNVTGVPYAVLIGPDGKVVWEGGPGGVSDKAIEALLASVKATAEMTEAKAAKRVAFAKKFVADGLYARAEHELRRVVALFQPDPKKPVEVTSPAAREAQEILASLEAPAIQAELTAQRDVAKLIGLTPNLDRPAEKLKGKEIEALAKRLRKKAGEVREATPRAAKMAEDWAAVFELPWKAMDKEGNPLNPKDRK